MGSGIEGIESMAMRASQGGTTRRELIKHGATGAAAVGLASMWSPSALASGGAGGGSLKVRSAELMLINRLTHGWTEEEGANYAAAGSFSAYRQSLLYPAAPFVDTELNNLIGPWQTYLNATPAQILLFPNPLDLVVFHQNATILRAIVSKNQALERMMEFWNDHFNTWLKQEGQFMLKTTWEREVLRPHALGSFRNLLHKTAEGGSMLLFLDQAYSTQPTPNENYARELMELHTLGESHPYTHVPAYNELDVLAAAQALTGYSYDNAFIQGSGPVNPATFYYFQWKAAQHYQGPKNFLNQPIPQTNSQAEGQFVIDTLLDHPDTRVHIAYKMARWLVGYSPDAVTVVNPAANYYQAYSGDIRVMMTSLLSYANLANAGQDPLGFLERRPLGFLCALARALRIRFPVDKIALVQELRRMGNAPMEWPSPDGYHHDPGLWIGSVFSRWELANKLLASPTDPAQAADRLDGISISDADLQSLVGPAPTIPDVANRIDQILTGGVMTDNEKSVLTAYMTHWFPIRNPWLVLRETFALAASCPTFQYI